MRPYDVMGGHRKRYDAIRCPYMASRGLGWPSHMCVPCAWLAGGLLRLPAHAVLRQEGPGGQGDMGCMHVMK